MLTPANTVREVDGADSRALADTLVQATQPVVLRGLVANWPVVRAGRESGNAGMTYLRGLYAGATVGAWRGAPEIDGRFFYNDTFDGFNFHAEHMKLDTVLDDIERHQRDQRPPAIYVGSTTVDTCLPGFRASNDLDLGERQPLMSIWIGNQTRIAAHYDLPDNLACVALGRRRFTLFPPAVLKNLYVGPLDFTPAGQAISLVDFAKPDLAKFPKFAQAMQQAQVAELEPGDAIFVPSMWWHHVEALEPFNVLINYWWRQSPDHMDSPMNALMLALMSVRDLPPAQRQAWQQLFQHYVFEPDASAVAHIPPGARGVMSSLDADASRVLRAQLLKKLNR